MDVVVSDVQLAGEAEGLRLLDAIARDGPAVLLLSSFDQPPLIRTRLRARGRRVPHQDQRGRRDPGRDPDGGRRAAPRSRRRCCARSGARRGARSDREMEVLALLCGGASNDEIGVRLGVTEKTVESHLRRLFDRYGVLSRTELAVLALREGWVAEKGRA